MRGHLLLVTAGLLIAHAGCRSSEHGKPHALRVVSDVCPNVALDPEVLMFLETTQNEVSNMIVGTADIFDRDLPDKSGKLRPQLSAFMLVAKPNEKDGVRLEVTAGSVVGIGADRYCIVEIGERGEGHPTGWVSLRKVVPQ